MGLFRTASRVAVASSVHGRVQERQRAARQAQVAAPAPVQAQAPAQPAPAPVAPAAAPAPSPTKDMDAMIAQLKQLGELRDLGVLTEAEFEGQKALLLAA